MITKYIYIAFNTLNTTKKIIIFYLHFISTTCFILWYKYRLLTAEQNTEIVKGILLTWSKLVGLKYPTKYEIN